MDYELKVNMIIKMSDYEVSKLHGEILDAIMDVIEKNHSFISGGLSLKCVST